MTLAERFEKKIAESTEEAVKLAQAFISNPDSPSNRTYLLCTLEYIALLKDGVTSKCSHCNEITLGDDTICDDCENMEMAEAYDDEE